MECPSVETYWAGYDSKGNDRPQHLHFCENGEFIRHDMKRGHLCGAPLDDEQLCTDPPPCKGPASIAQ